MTKLTFIVPSFNEVDNVEPFYDSFDACFASSGFEWELVFIDDGSTDGTYDRLKALAKNRPGVVAISFSRNFGKEAAIWAGLNNASGDIVGIIDADLQQSPEDALRMVRILEESSRYDCVAAYQEERYEKGILRAFKTSFYRIMAKASGMDIVENASDFRVFRKNVVDAILSLPESYRFSKGIFAWIGFETYPYPYTPKDRAAGESKWSFSSLVKYAIEGVLAFSTSPLRLATVLGLFTSLIALLYFVVVIAKTLTFGVDVPGYATTIGLVLLLGGVQLFVMGIMGEYLARTYIQGKGRPIYIERDRVASCNRRNGREHDGRA